MPAIARVFYRHQLLKRRTPRKRTARPAKPTLTITQILAWSDDYHKDNGHWPKQTSGPISRLVNGTWRAVDCALRMGMRGLPGGSSLVRVLARYRGVRNPRALPHLTVPQILKWADEHHKRTGKWPAPKSGAIPQAPTESWQKVDAALRNRLRGLRKKSSLARLLAAHRGVRNIMALPRLSEKLILQWADAHHKRTGKWPTTLFGAIKDAHGETWIGVESALRYGGRGLPGGSSLARVLEKHGRTRNEKNLPTLSIKQLLSWADEHHRRTGKWPKCTSGRVLAVPCESWSAIHTALEKGMRGLPGGSSLARLLSTHRNVRNLATLPPLKEKQILSWADAHHKRTGKWPGCNSGPIRDAPGETWITVDDALRKGGRGLSAGSSIARLLEKHGRARNRRNLPPLSVNQILRWADDRHRRTGKWPTRRSGVIRAAPSESWRAVSMALEKGYRGFPGGSSLTQLLLAHRRV
jgi:hypothetical protein